MKEYKVEERFKQVQDTMRQLLEKYEALQAELAKVQTAIVEHQGIIRELAPYIEVKDPAAVVEEKLDERS